MAELDGPSVALALVEPLAAELDGHHLFHAVRGDLLVRLGRLDEARNAFTAATDCAANETEREFSAVVSPNWTSARTGNDEVATFAPNIVMRDLWASKTTPRSARRAVDRRDR